MRFVGAPGSEDRKKFLAICGFAVVAAGVLYYEMGGSDTPVAPPAAPVVISAPASTPAAAGGDDASGSETPSQPSGPAAKVIGTTSAALDPTLHMGAMLVTESVAYDGTGRNIFSAMSAPVIVIAKPVGPARPKVVTPPPPPVVPCPPNCPPPPPPPPIDLKFCGYFASPKNSDKKAILVHGDEVVLALPGDIVLRRYKVISIAANSIQVEDMTNNNRQTLPLLVN